MGMFDTILCKYPLPLSELLQELKETWASVDFQTKDLDCDLALYVINEAGELHEEVVEREYICYTEEELATIKPKPWNPYKEIVVKNKYLKPIAHHGVINFYNSLKYSATQDIWVEFNAYFIYGKLDKIELFKVDFLNSYEVNNQLYQEAAAAKEKLLWNRTKKILSYIGWRRFWIKIANCCYTVQNWLGKLQQAIYSKML
jgi:hypothetical protein